MHWFKSIRSHHQTLTSLCNLWHHWLWSPRGPQRVPQSVKGNWECFKTKLIFNSCDISSALWNDFTIMLPSGLIFYSWVLTKGNPKPALAQLTEASCSFSTSAIGLARFEGGNSGPWQTGHWYPAGAVWRGSRDARLLRQDQWKTSAGERSGKKTCQSRHDVLFNAVCIGTFSRVCGR